MWCPSLACHMSYLTWCAIERRNVSGAVDPRFHLHMQPERYVVPPSSLRANASGNGLQSVLEKKRKSEYVQRTPDGAFAGLDGQSDWL